MTFGGETCPGNVVSIFFSSGYLNSDINYSLLVVVSDVVVFFFISTTAASSNYRLKGQWTTFGQVRIYCVLPEERKPF